MKQVAQRSYVTYCKSIHLMKDKSVFDIQKLDLNALARSMGLSIAPRIRFYEKFLVGKNSDAKVQAVKPSERWRSNAEEATFRFYDDEENRSSDSDDDILKMKRKDHELEEGSSDEIAEEKKKKDKHLTKEQAAKRIIRKKLTANKITNFDEEGNVCLLSDWQLTFINLNNLSVFNECNIHCLSWKAIRNWLIADLIIELFKCFESNEFLNV